MASSFTLGTTLRAIVSVAPALVEAVYVVKFGEFEVIVTTATTDVAVMPRAERLEFALMAFFRPCRNLGSCVVRRQNGIRDGLLSAGESRIFEDDRDGIAGGVGTSDGDVFGRVLEDAHLERLCCTAAD